ncbi:hypothetical protein VTG60DRAFT_5831 [Thermothelomyces hinnuleus]
MSVCPALDLTSVAHFTGSPLASPDLDDTGTCPAIPTGEDCSGPIFDLLGGIGVILGPMSRLGRLCLMDLELEDIARYVGKALGVIAFVLAVAAAPILWVIQTSFVALRSVFSTVFSAASSAGNGILRIAITPFLIPWHIAAWAWEVALNLYDELEAREPGSRFDVNKDTDNRHPSPSSSTSASPSSSGRALARSLPS